MITDCSRAGLPQWYRVHLTSEQSRFNAQSWQPEMTLEIIACKPKKTTGDDRSTLTLKPMGRVIQNTKQRVPVVPQNGLRSNKNFNNKKQ